MKCVGTMTSYAFLVVVSLSTLQLTSGQTSTTPDACTAAVATLMTDCLKPASLTTANFLWFVSNGTSPSGTAPTDQNAFKTQLCTVTKNALPCMIARIRPLVDSTCQANTALLVKMQQYLMTYDLKCVSACVPTLMTDLQKCYNNVGISADLFISNKTAGGKFIGTTKAEAESVCAKKDAILSCLKPIHDNCPDAKSLLKSIGFSLHVFEKALNFLCTRTADYIAALPCFAAPNAAVQKCIENEVPKIQKANDDNYIQQWTEAQYIQTTCTLTQEKLQCDIAAWDGTTTATCTPQIKAFRKEMECTLLPDSCTTNHVQLFSGLCNTPNTQVKAPPVTSAPATTTPPAIAATTPSATAPTNVNIGQSAGQGTGGANSVFVTGVAKGLICFFFIFLVD